MKKTTMYIIISVIVILSIVLTCIGINLFVKTKQKQRTSTIPTETMTAETEELPHPWNYESLSKDSNHLMTYVDDLSDCDYNFSDEVLASLKVEDDDVYRVAYSLLCSYCMESSTDGRNVTLVDKYYDGDFVIFTFDTKVTNLIITVAKAGDSGYLDTVDS